MSDLGHFRRVDPATVDDDPFWSVVRRRHPDVDLVLLPDDPPPPADPSPGLAPEALEAVVDGVLATWAALAPLVRVGDDPTTPSVDWAAGTGGHALLVEKGIRGLGADGGTALLRAIAVRLGQDGWRLSASRRQGLPLLRATDGLLDLEATAGPGATVLTLATGVLPVDAPERDTVRDRVVEAVASWR